MSSKTKKVVGLGLLTAVLIVLQVLASFVPTKPVSITLTLVPIIIGIALYGELAGVWLGLVFGLVVLFDPSTATFMSFNPMGTVVTVILKGVMAGLCAGLVYRVVEKKSPLVAVILAGIVAPVVNTGIFLLACRLFFYDLIKGFAGGANVLVFMLTAFVGMNFLIELAVNMILSTTIVRIIQIGRRSGVATADPESKKEN